MKQNARLFNVPEDFPIYEDFADFCSWYADLFKEDILDLQEAATIYFNLETYTII